MIYKNGSLEGIEGGDSGLTESTTINLLLADSTAEKQAKIDAVPRSALPGVTVTFQFEDGTHTETATLTFEGFAYPIEILGNASDTGLSTSKSVDIVFGNSYGFTIDNCASFRVKWLDIQCTTTTDNILIYCRESNGELDACYIHGTGTGGGIAVDSVRGPLSVSNCYISNIKHGIYAYASRIYSNNNDDTGTPPLYGLTSTAASTIGKNGTQPAGSTANENPSKGGIIR